MWQPSLIADVRRATMRTSSACWKSDDRSTVVMSYVGAATPLRTIKVSAMGRDHHDVA